MEVYCDSCKKNFTVEGRTAYIDKDVEEVFFNCPHCHERFISHYLNDDIKKKQKKVRKAKNNFARNKLMKEIKIEMDELNIKYGTQ